MSLITVSLRARWCRTLAFLCLVWPYCVAAQELGNGVLEGRLQVRVGHLHDSPREPFQFVVTADENQRVAVIFDNAFPVDPIRLDSRRVRLRGDFQGNLLTRLFDTGLNAPVFQATLVETEPLSEPPPSSVPPPVIAATPSDSGQWSAVIPLPRVAINASLLPSGQVLFWGMEAFVGGSAPDFTFTYLWDPANDPAAENVTEILNDRTFLFCSGHSLRPDGQLLTAGGHVEENQNGSIHSDFFNPSSNVWTPGPDMNNGRWYPSTAILNTDGTLVAGGTFFNTDGDPVVNTVPQVFQNGAWRDLTTASSVDYYFYPWTFQSPNGQVFIAGPSAGTTFLSVSGTGRLSSGPLSNFGYRSYGSAVMYDATGRILIMGGPNTSSAEVINLNTATPTWRYVDSMAFARMFINATVLPDGKVFVAGGTSSDFNDNSKAVFPAELWDPATGEWTVLASLAEPRLYHSTSLLLPDGRVFVAGGGQPAAENGGSSHFNMEIFSPPYLFRGTRPTISSVSSTLRGGSSHDVMTPSANQITKVSLVRLGSVTHSFDENQRIYFPSFERLSQSVRITLTANRGILPLGHYMLFIINDVGVPSMAAIVRVT